METIKKYDVDRMRAEASRRIHRMFKGAVEINVHYGDIFAEAYCRWPDGIIECAALFYRDLLREEKTVRKEPRPQGQYGRARRMVEELYGEACGWQ